MDYISIVIQCSILQSKKPLTIDDFSDIVFIDVIHEKPNKQPMKRSTASKTKNRKMGFVSISVARFSNGTHWWTW